MAKRSRLRRGRDQPHHRFQSRRGDPKKQPEGIVKRLQGGRIRSVGTARNYQERLAQIELTLRVWKTLFADKPLRSDLDRARDPPTH
ncbi:MAG: hypothetical protein OXP09_06500 [Gammaproteobacteria bacterium]|nr:hypothetical protein [Gammaproteobacteria bacterium]